jgi:hypothetical protein
MSRQMRNYAFTPVFVNTTPVMNGSEQATLITFMNETCRASVLQTISMNQVQTRDAVKLPTGNHEIGIQYTYPDVNGNDVKGTLFPFRFNYGTTSYIPTNLIWRL